MATQLLTLTATNTAGTFSASIQTTALAVQDAVAATFVDGFVTFAVSIVSPMSSVPPAVSSAPPPTTTVIFAQVITSKEVPLSYSGVPPQIGTVIVTPERPAASRTEVVAPTVAPTPTVASAPTTQIVGGFLGSPPGTPSAAEMPLFINGLPGASETTPSEGSTTSPGSGQTTGSSLQIIAPWSSSPTEEPVAATAATSGNPLATTPFQQHSTPLDVSGSGTMSPSLASLLENFGNGAGSRSGGDKDAGLTQMAAQRKALALGLRYLYPDMTDDEIAQAAGVSRRTLFRWEEYMTLKKAQRVVYKRPRGYKDRAGNLEAWTEDEGE